MERRDTIAVLGAGNAGYAMAGDLASRGYPVVFYEHPSFAGSFSGTLSTREVFLEGALGEKAARVEIATTHMEEVLEASSFLNLVVPSTAQEHFFQAMLPHLRDGDTVVVWSGRFGSLRLLHLLKQAGAGRQVTVAEVNTLPYGVRRTGPGTARILYTAIRLYAAAVPRRRAGQVLPKLGSLYKGIHAPGSLLSVAFSNPALVVFGTGALLNVGRIERTGGRFYLFAEGITPGVAGVMHAAHMEIEGVGHALGLPVPHYTQEEFRQPGSIEGVNFTSPGGTSDFARMDGPSSVRGRYMMENIGDGIVPVVELAKKAGMCCPVLDSIVTLGSVVCQEDFRKNGRNLERLGLANLELDEICRLAAEGM